MTCELVSPVSNEATEDAAWSRAFLASSSGVRNSDIISLRAHIQELQPRNEDLIACRVGIQKMQMNRALKLCYGK